MPDCTLKVGAGVPKAESSALKLPPGGSDILTGSLENPSTPIPETRIRRAARLKSLAEFAWSPIHRWPFAATAMLCG